MGRDSLIGVGLCAVKMDNSTLLRMVNVHHLVMAIYCLKGYA